MEKSPPILRKNVCLQNYSTLKVGGPADYLVEVQNQEELLRVLSFANRQQLPFITIGKGSNCLFPDEGIRGIAIVNKIDFCNVSEGHIHVGSGYNFSLLGTQMSRRGRTGLEFASGIPGTVGGAIFMNAGAGDQDTSQVVREVEFCDEEGKIHFLQRNAIAFGYRTSPFQTMKGVILSARFSLELSDTARKDQIALIHYRTGTQPYKEASIGCFFRNPKGESAGALIEQLSLKGLSVGDAAVSDIHANFLINKGQARARDFLELLTKIQKIVLEKTGNNLELEVRIISQGLNA